MTKIETFGGYPPFYLGLFFGNNLAMGGERNFIHCADFRAGISDTEWWWVEILNDLTVAQRAELKAILHRNYEFYNFTREIAPYIATEFGVPDDEIYLIHRLTTVEKVLLLYTLDKLRGSHMIFNFIEKNNIGALESLDIAPNFLVEYKSWLRRNFKPTNSPEEVPNLEELDPNWLSIIIK